MVANTVKEIKRLIKKFNDVQHEMDYVEFIITNKDISNEEQEEYEMEADLLIYELYHIANQINKLNPSKYMVEKHTDLEYILSLI